MKKQKLVHNGVHYVFFESLKNTNNFVYFLHGSGEGGHPDGSQLNKVEYNGLAKYANTIEYPFHIIAPQGIKLPGYAITDFSQVRKNTQEILKKHGAKKTIITGLSQGGQEVLGWYTNSISGGANNRPYSGGSFFDGFLPVCGSCPGTPTWGSVDKPCLLVHGDADTAVTVWQSRKVVIETKKISGMINIPRLIEITGGTHSSAWVKGYDIDDKYGKQVFEFINNILVDEVVPVPEPQPTIHKIVNIVVNDSTLELEYTAEDGTKFKGSTVIKL